MRPEDRGVRREGRWVYLEDVGERQLTEWLNDLVERSGIQRWSTSEGPFGPRFVIHTPVGVDHVTFGLMGSYLRGLEVGLATSARQ